MESINDTEVRLAQEVRYYIDLTKENEEQPLEEQKKRLLNALTAIREYINVLDQQLMINKAMR